MYEKLKSHVMYDKSNLSESFECVTGVRQGCMISPLLFILYLNELVNMCKAKEGTGIYVSEEFSNVSLLLYAMIWR